MISKIPCLIVRGGTSKGIYLERDDLPPFGPERDRLILGLFGSPDKRQIDGLGGADKLTSKVAVMGPPTRDDCVVDYHFGQVMINLPQIDWKSNCGNLTAGAAVYAVYKSYADAEGDFAEFGVHQVNTGRRLAARVPLIDGMPMAEGGYAIGGVPGFGARIDVDFADFGGCTLNRGVFPTGNLIDSYQVSGLGKVEASVLDMGNLCIFVRCADLGMDHELDIVSLQGDSQVVANLEAIRAVIADDLGYITGPNATNELLVKVNPLLQVVGPPRDYQNLNQQDIPGGEYDLFARSITRGLFSKAYPGSGSSATGVAAGIPGTIVAEASAGGPRPVGESYSLRIGHPSGVLEVKAKVDLAEVNDVKVAQAEIGRTGRVLMDGMAHVRH
jgi:2-methylaconitate cis-trans-isomerase PrpF